MAEIRKLQVNDTEIYPVTHESAVYDSDGKTISSKYISSVAFGEDVDLPEADINETLQTLGNRLNTIEEELDEIKEHIDNNTSIADKAGNLTDLRTEHKDDIVGAVNELVSDLSDISNSVSSKVDTSTYTSKVTELETAFNQAFQSGNSVKQQLVDALIAKELDVSTNDSFDKILNEMNNIKSNVIEGYEDFPEWFFDYYSDIWNPVTTNNDLFNFYTLPSGIALGSSAIVGNNIYLIGGMDEEENLITNVYCFNTETGEIAIKRELPQKDYSLTSVPVGNLIYTMGGYGSESSKSRRNLCYDPSTDSWTTKTNMTGRRFGHSATAINNKIYVFGGSSNDTTPTKTCYCYDPSANSWTTKSNMPINIIDGDACTVENHAYIIGGLADTGYVTSTYRYDPNANAYSTLATLPAGRTDHRCAVIDNKIYMINGDFSSYTPDDGGDGWSLYANLNFLQGYWTNTGEFKSDAKYVAVEKFNARDLLAAYGAIKLVVPEGYELAEPYLRLVADDGSPTDAFDNSKLVELGIKESTISNEFIFSINNSELYEMLYLYPIVLLDFECNIEASEIPKSSLYVQDSSSGSGSVTPRETSGWGVQQTRSMTNGFPSFCYDVATNKWTQISSTTFTAALESYPYLTMYHMLESDGKTLYLFGGYGGFYDLSDSPSILPYVWYYIPKVNLK
jgi:N-acetylneuraminic acid mutarotase